MDVRHGAGKILDAHAAINNPSPIAQRLTVKSFGLSQSLLRAGSDDVGLFDCLSKIVLCEARPLKEPRWIHRQLAVQRENHRQSQSSSRRHGIVGVGADAM